MTRLVGFEQDTFHGQQSPLHYFGTTARQRVEFHVQYRFEVITSRNYRKGFAHEVVLPNARVSQCFRNITIEGSCAVLLVTTEEGLAEEWTSERSLGKWLAVRWIGVGTGKKNLATQP